MDFENLQAIWNTQNEEPVFAMKDPRFLVALYQQREHARRRVFKEHFAPMYWIVPLLLLGLGLTFLAFFYKSLHIEELGRDFPMSVWDYVAFAVAGGWALATVVSMHAERKKHDRTQEGFAPSLREELGRGIVQLDFELSLQSSPRFFRLIALIIIGALILAWEMGRLNGNPTSWPVTMMTMGSMGVAGWASLLARNAVIERVTARKHVLESMLANLDEANVKNT